MDMKEQLSALVDGELGRDERAFLLRRLEHDEELRATWTRYHLMRDVLARRHTEPEMDLSGRVMAALDAPQVAATTGRQPVAGWMRPALGLAVAASVAWMATLLVAPSSSFLPREGVAELAPAVRAERPVGVPGPIMPRLDGLGHGVQPVAAERSFVLPVQEPGLEQMLLLRHAQMTGGPWVIAPAPQMLREEQPLPQLRGSSSQP